MFNRASLRSCLGFRNGFLLIALIAWPLGAHVFGTETFGTTSPNAKGSQLRLECVNLFPAGQAVFEFVGNSNDELTLWLSREELDDLHKSIVLSGFRDISIEYESSPDKNWISNSLKQREHATLAEIIQSFRGQGIRIQNGIQTETGKILCVESIARPQNQNTLDEEWVSIESDGKIRRVPLLPSSVISWLEPRMNNLFQNATKRQQGNDDGREPVLIRVRGDEGQKGRFAVQWAASPWKTSYRISRSLDGYLLTASAIVDNTTPMDWQNVTLRLIVDQPLGFRSPLSQILVANRKVLPVPNPFAMSPPMFAGRSQSLDGVNERISADSTFHQLQGEMVLGPMPAMGGMGGMAMGGSMGGMGGMRMGGSMGGGYSGMQALGGYGESLPESNGENGYGTAGGYGGADVGVGATNEKNKRMSQRYGLQAGVEDGSRNLIGRRVQIEIPNVTILRSQSQSLSMPPIPQHLRELRILAPGLFDQRVLAAFEVQLRDDYQFPSGPGTVWTDAGYEGDIMLPRLSSDQSQLITYAVDSMIRLEKTVERQEDPIFEWKWNSKLNVIEEKSTLSRVIQYSIENRAAKAFDLLLEHPTNKTGWQPMGAEETPETSDIYRYRIELAARGITTKDITEQKVLESQIDAKSNRAKLESLLDQPLFPSYLSIRVNQWLESQTKATRLSNRVSQESQRIKSFESEQSRIQKLLEVISKEDKLYSRYLEKLDKLEDSIEKSRALCDSLEQELDAMREGMHQP